MKNLLCLIAITLHITYAQAQSLKPGNIIGLHTIEVDLQPGVGMEEYQTFWEDLVLPVYAAQLEGVQMKSLYGKRGDCEGCIGMMMIVESEAVRNKYWKAEGGWTDHGMKKLEKIQFVLDEMTNRYGTFTSTYTDWLVDPDWDEIDMDLLGASPTSTGSIRGTWALIHGEYGGNVRQPDGEIFQYKIFDDTHFSLNMRDGQTGKWDRSAIGKYNLEGDTYTETFLQSSDERFTGGTAKWKYRVEGDTLHMEGPLEIMDKDGKPAYQNMLNTMKEVRVRVE